MIVRILQKTIHFAPIVNANFAALNLGVNAKLVANYTLTCGAGFQADYASSEFIAVPWIDERTNSALTSSAYTIPENGIYLVTGDYPTVSQTSTFEKVNVRLEYYNGSAWVAFNQSAQFDDKLMRFTAGDQIRVVLGCGTKINSSTNVDVLAAKAFFMVKKM